MWKVHSCVHNSIRQARSVGEKRTKQGPFYGKRTRAAYAPSSLALWSLFQKSNLYADIEK